MGADDKSIVVSIDWSKKKMMEKTSRKRLPNGIGSDQALRFPVKKRRYVFPGC